MLPELRNLQDAVHPALCHIEIRPARNVVLDVIAELVGSQRQVVQLDVDAERLLCGRVDDDVCAPADEPKRDVVFQILGLACVNDRLGFVAPQAIQHELLRRIHALVDVLDRGIGLIIVLRLMCVCSEHAVVALVTAV